jgi:glycosyltransferase involved in cell wall biosynthesis
MGAKLNIAIIGPGAMPIPPVGWGAVEILIWDYYLSLTRQGHNVTIFNDSNLTNVSNRINTTRFDCIHCQYDEHINFFSKTLNQPFISTTHYGWLLKRPCWDDGYINIFNGTLNSPGILALSPEIKNFYIKSGYKGKVAHLRNGANVKQFNFASTGNGKAICVGKIETRKRQTQVANVSENKCQIDFVGPVTDNNFKDNNTCKNIGVWNKDQLYGNLTDYSCLVLMSNGEAAPLVVMEALAAGLSLVVSGTSSANLPASPFISVVKDEDIDDNLPDIINTQIHNNNRWRKQIRQLALDYFDWDVIAKEYITIIEQFFD